LVRMTGLSSKPWLESWDDTQRSPWLDTSQFMRLRYRAPSARPALRARPTLSAYVLLFAFGLRLRPLLWRHAHVIGGDGLPPHQALRAGVRPVVQIRGAGRVDPHLSPFIAAISGRGGQLDTTLHLDHVVAVRAGVDAPLACAPGTIRVHAILTVVQGVATAAHMPEVKLIARFR